MGKINNIGLVIIMSFIFSCKMQTHNKLDDKELENKVIEISTSYINKLNTENKDHLYIYLEKEVGNNKYYRFTLYNSGVLTENLNFPYKYLDKKDFTLFFFDEQKYTSKELKEHLKRDSLWVSLSNIDEFKKYKPVIVLSDGPVWDIFICKKNINKFKIVESAYGIEKANIDLLCD